MYNYKNLFCGSLVTIGRKRDLNFSNALAGFGAMGIYLQPEDTTHWADNRFYNVMLDGVCIGFVVADTIIGLDNMHGVVIAVLHSPYRAFAANLVTQCIVLRLGLVATSTNNIPS